MIALEQARQHLETLGLKQAVEVLDNTLDSAASKQLSLIRDIRPGNWKLFKVIRPVIQGH